MTDSKTAKKGICKTCRHYVNQVCRMNVMDRGRGRNQSPCGWWEARKS